MRRFCGRVSREGVVFTMADGHATNPAIHLECRILCNGYVADRPDLAAALDIESGASTDDADLFAHAYRKWGAGLTRYVLGEYAIFLFDNLTQSCLLTHDSLGLAPVFYSTENGDLVFTTHLIDILDGSAGTDIDEHYLAEFLATGYLISERTPYRSIKRLLPGRSLTWRRGHIRQPRSWDLAQIAPQRYGHDREYEECFRTLVTAGVRASLGQTGQTWVALSGGLDSSTVASVAAREGATGLGSFSMISPGFPEANEERWMREVVDRYQLPWHSIDVETVLPFSELPDGFLAEPTLAVINAARRRVTNELFASHGVTTVLTGDGGDSILGTVSSIPGHLSDQLFAGRPLACLHALNAWAGGAPEMRPWSYWMLRGVIGPALGHLRGFRVRTSADLPLPPWIDPGYASAMRLLERDRRRRATRCLQPGRQEVWDTIWSGALSMAAWPTTLQNHAVRTPLLYRPLVEFMCAIPWEQRLRPNCDRYLQRRALRGILPERVRRRANKAGGTWPVVEGLRRSKEWIAYLNDDPQIAKLGITEPGKWRAAIIQAATGQTFGDRYFLTGVAIEAWLKSLSAWKDKRGNSPTFRERVMARTRQ